MEKQNIREQKGKEIALKSDLIRVSDYHYHVHSQTTFRDYDVVKLDGKWTCSCPDHRYRNRICCKHIHLKGDRNNNKMERLNGEIRDREKVMRGLKKVDTPILKGYEIYHNFIRSHQSLDGKTPSEACGISIKGENKWISLIQNASGRK